MFWGKEGWGDLLPTLLRVKSHLPLLLLSSLTALSFYVAVQVEGRGWLTDSTVCHSRLAAHQTSDMLGHQPFFASHPSTSLPLLTTQTVKVLCTLIDDSEIQVGVGGLW